MAFEISRFVAIHSMAKDQILCSCGRADGIRLDKTHALDGGFQGARMKERMRNGESAQLLKVWHKTGTIKSTRVIKVGNGDPFCAPLVIPKPALSARNLLAASSETADS